MNDEDSKAIADLINKSMKKLGITQKEIYLTLNINKSTMSNYLRGKHLSVAVVIQIINYIDDYQTTVESEKILFHSEPFPDGQQSGTTPLEISYFYGKEDSELDATLKHLTGIMAARTLTADDARLAAFEAIDVVGMAEKLTGTLQRLTGLTSSQLMEGYQARQMAGGELNAESSY